jgi:hypothetical protein
MLQPIPMTSVQNVLERLKQRSNIEAVLLMTKNKILTSSLKDTSVTTTYAQFIVKLIQQSDENPFQKSSEVPVRYMSLLDLRKIFNT